jgi:hypothetical protein
MSVRRPWPGRIEKPEPNRRTSWRSRGDAVADPGDTPELLAVEMDQLARPLALIAHYCRFRFERRQLAQSCDRGRDGVVAICRARTELMSLAAHPNVTLHFTPTSAGWLNQVEIWFGIFTRKALSGASFRSAEQLTQAIRDFTAADNETAAPFVWRKREVKGSQLRHTIVNLRKLDTSRVAVVRDRHRLPVPIASVPSYTTVYSPTNEPSRKYLAWLALRPDRARERALVHNIRNSIS